MELDSFSYPIIHQLTIKRLLRLKKFLEELNLSLIGIRDVPVNSSILGKASAKCEPRMQQFFVNRPRPLRERSGI